MIPYASRDGRLRLYRGDSRRLTPIATGSVAVILTSPPYWTRGHGLRAADRYARDLAVRFGPEWRRVLAPDGDLWLVIGDRHDGIEWAGIDGLVTGWLRRTGWRLQSRGFWAQTRSRERWDNRVNYVLRYRKAGAAPVRPRGDTLCWMVPLPRSHPDSVWDAMPEAIVEAVLAASKKRGPVLDPFAGAGTGARVVAARGREWIGIERDPRMARVAVRRLRLRPLQAPVSARPGARARAARATPRRTRSRRVGAPAPLS